MIYLLTQMVLWLVLAGVAGGAVGWLLHRARAGREDETLRETIVRQHHQLRHAETDVAMLTDDFNDLKQRSQTELETLRHENRRLPTLLQNLDKSQTLVRQLMQKHEAQLREAAQQNETLRARLAEHEGRESELARVRSALETARAELDGLRGAGAATAPLPASPPVPGAAPVVASAAPVAAAVAAASPADANDAPAATVGVERADRIAAGPVGPSDPGEPEHDGLDRDGPDHDEPADGAHGGRTALDLAMETDATLAIPVSQLPAASTGAARLDAAADASAAFGTVDRDPERATGDGSLDEGVEAAPAAWPDGAAEGLARPSPSDRDRPVVAHGADEPEGELGDELDDGSDDALGDDALGDDELDEDDLDDDELDDDELDEDEDLMDDSVELLFEPVDRHDDLQRIFGIGPVTEKALNRLGITSYSQLAELQRHEVEQIADALQIYPGRIERDDWVGNARRQLEDVLEEL